MELSDLQRIIDNEIGKIDRKRQPAELYEPIWYTLNNGGKRLRPALVLMGCYLFSDDVEKAALPALGIEMFHNFTLLHDDIMDKAFLRRNQPTVHAKWDINRAILSGDALAIQSNVFISSCDRSVLPEVLNVFNTTALQVCEGQQYDLNFELVDSVTEQEYLKMISLKTAVLLAGSLQIGALIGGAEMDISSRVYDFGFNMGMAFQLQDDYLDTFGDSAVFGKKIGGDILANKKTLLTIKALDLADDELKQELVGWYADKHADTQQKIQRVIEIFRLLHVDSLTRELVCQYSWKALDQLDQLPVDLDRKEALRKFTLRLMDRVK